METTSKQVAKIIREYVGIDEDAIIVGVNAAADEIVHLMQPWKPIKDAPLNEKIDLLSNAVIRFTDCRWDKDHQQWVRFIRYLDSSGEPQTVINVIKNASHFMTIPPSPFKQ